ncbi:MAG TPA: DUF1697 domain-containing protein [Gemmatimonadaceae bacterium]|nr:DUF1697 domain-containing protein [Gemmatimonadaceae bacterium]
MSASKAARGAKSSRRYVALLRAINVGGHTVRMERLRAIFESLGFTAVSTFIASGNVIFESAIPKTAEIETTLENRLCTELGYEVATFIRTGAELETIVAQDPFDGRVTEGWAMWVGFVRIPPTADAEKKLMSLSTPVDSFVIVGREIYWLRKPGESDPKLSGAKIDKALGMQSTFRNITTVRKLAALTKA